MQADQPVRGTTSEVRHAAYRDGAFSSVFDRVATEEPLEIRIVAAGRTVPVAVTMRTPGNDFELAAGFLLSEGIVTASGDIASITYCVDPGVDADQRYNIVNVALGALPASLERLERHFVVSSACGVCGKAHLDQLETRGIAKLRNAWSVDPSLVLSLPSRLAGRQKVFQTTGGLHAAALFDRSGNLVAVREDVGRHNALDKVCGWALLERRLPLEDSIALVSGRASFELLQKAAVARIALLCAVSAPSSLAVELAEQFGITLVAFLREGRFNVYAHPERIAG